MTLERVEEIVERCLCSLPRDEQRALIASWRERGEALPVWSRSRNQRTHSYKPCPQEWSPKSGIGVMLAALGCKSIRLDDEARAALAAEPASGDRP